MINQTVNISVFRSFFEKEKLSGPNFIDWYRNLRIVLMVEDKLTFFEQPIHGTPVLAKGQVLPQQLLNITSNVLVTPMSLNLVVSSILISLSNEYDGIVQNYNMHGMGKTINELHAMLKLHEETLPKKEVAHVLHVIRACRIQKNNNKNKKSQMAAKGINQGNGKTKLTYAPNPNIPPPPKKDNPANDAIYHQCSEVGHWRRNCPLYLAELTKKKKLSLGAILQVSSQ
ncbi:zinc finger, CCHC-type containing protein [Tanacetum coccineum]